MLRGLATMLTMPIDGAARSWSAALGLLEVAVGACVWVWPGPTLLVLAVFIGWWGGDELVGLPLRTGQPHFSSRNQV